MKPSFNGLIQRDKGFTAKNRQSLLRRQVRFSPRVQIFSKMNLWWQRRTRDFPHNSFPTNITSINFPPALQSEIFVGRSAPRGIGLSLEDSAAPLLSSSNLHQMERVMGATH